MAPQGGGNIKVVVRVRPFNNREKEHKSKCVVSMNGTQTVLTPPQDPTAKARSGKAAQDGSRTFAFDKSYWSFERKDEHFAGQEDVFSDLGKPLLDNAFQGYNNCIFAYGQTGSGKSYSMMGYGEETGVIPRICQDMFERIQAVQSTDVNLTSRVEVSYLEIYNERVRDLLNPANKGNLRVREHPATGPYVEDLAKLVVRDFNEIEHLMDEGNKARTVAATNMNETSSRSHAVFTLTLTQKRHDVETNMDTEKVAKISLVDLAGSERATSTGATGARLKEGAEINRSLSTLGRVIAALAELSDAKGKTKGKQVPYRDSVLTWLLKDSLGGNSLTAMIAAISPADINFEETLSTLRYADSAKRIKNHAVVNEDPNARMIRELKEELAQLRSKLSGAGSGLPQEQYSADTPLEKQFVTITAPDGSTKQVSKAEIAEQLSQSEKLYKDLNQTWEQKLASTEKIHRERETALEELGISIEKGNVGLSTPKKMPHLVNLADDALLAECLVYNIKPGTTILGNPDKSTDAQPPHVDIRLNGSKILPEHCTFENIDNVVTVVPREGAAILVNGVRIETPKRLRSGYRVILGDFHVFRFNHPQEAREERDHVEQDRGSLLKYAVTPDDVDDTPSRPNRLSQVAGHYRNNSTMSRGMSDGEGPDSPLPPSGAASPWRQSLYEADNDWAFARREAASNILGPETKISALTDDELDVLFDDVQRIRAVRKGRSLFDAVASNLTDTDSESVASRPLKDLGHLSGTWDNASVDTVLTVPTSPPQQNWADGGSLEVAKLSLEQELSQQPEELHEDATYQSSDINTIEQLRAEKANMEAEMRAMKEDMQRQLQEQRESYELRVKDTRTPPKASKSWPFRSRTAVIYKLSDQETSLARSAVHRWQGQRFLAMAAALLKHAALLKEAQVLSQKLDRNIVFQFAIADVGHALSSSYDLVLKGVGQEDSNDPELEKTPKPCVVVRVTDYHRFVVTIWSLEKLRRRVRVMRQMHQYLNDRGPQVSQHFKIDSAFDDMSMPGYTRIGDADLPLSAVFECRVQDFVLDVWSSYTCSVVGTIRLSLEPSPAQAPRETLKFNVVMHELSGLAEREATSVHAQLFIPGIHGEDGVTATTLVQGFGESAIRFLSVHGMSLPMSAPRDATLRISVFGKVSQMHLDKLLSWDELRESSPDGPRLPESEFVVEEQHDAFTRVLVLEIGEDGAYAPVECIQASTMDAGAFQLHQGLQRRIVLTLVTSASATLPWDDVPSVKIGDVKLLDEAGRVADSVDGDQRDILLPLISPPEFHADDDGTVTVTLTGQWDSSAHGNILLDRPTQATEHRRVQLTLSWLVQSSRTIHPMKFSMDIAVQTRPRSWFRQNSLLSQLWHNQRVVHSTAAHYVVTLKPATVKHAGDLWRLDTSGEYVAGEEELAAWKPRGIDLLQDFLSLRSRKQRQQEVEASRAMLSDSSPVLKPIQLDEVQVYTARQRRILERALDLWRAPSYSALDLPIFASSTENANSSAPPSPKQASQQDLAANEPAPPVAAKTMRLKKSPVVLKAGWLLTPDSAGKRWIKRYAELRPPFIHLYDATGDEVGALRLTGARIDSEPALPDALQRSKQDGGRAYWAIYARSRALVFASRSEKERGEWVWGVDRGMLGASESGTDDD